MSIATRSTRARPVTPTQVPLRIMMAQSASVRGEPAAAATHPPAHQAKLSGSAVVYLICSMAKLELTSNRSAVLISFLYTAS